MNSTSNKASPPKVAKGFFSSIAQGGLVGLYESYAERKKKRATNDEYAKESEPILKSTFKKAVDFGEKGLIGHGIREGATLISKNLGKHRFAPWAVIALRWWVMTTNWHTLWMENPGRVLGSAATVGELAGEKEDTSRSVTESAELMP